MSKDELHNLHILSKGASLRFLITRLFDWYHTPKNSYVKRKDPQEYIDKLLYFIDDNVDHFGNLPPDSKYSQLNNPTGIVESGPYANQSFGNRFKYSFFPQPLEGSKLRELPKWFH